MNIILKTSWSMIKRKKIQSILIGIIITLIAMLLYIGVSIMNLSSPSTSMFERANATENLLIINKETDRFEDTIDWWSNQKEVAGLSSYEGLMVNVEYSLGESVESELLMITEFEADSEYDLMYETQDTLAKAPKGNEILINYNFAKSRDLIIGDSLTFKNDNKTFTFIVSGFLVDPQFSSPFITVDRCFVEKGFFEKEGIINGNAILGIKYKNLEFADQYGLYEAYKKELNIQPLFADHESLAVSYSIISGIIGATLLSVSLFIFAIVVFVIRATVRNTILQQYKQIGVKKVIGYTNKQIRHSFLWMYNLIGIIAASIGVLLGMPIRNLINAGINADLQVGLKSEIDIYTLITVVIIVALISLFTLIATKQTNKIKPVQAIKYGMPERKVSVNGFNITKSKALPLSILLSIKQILVNKRKAIATTFTITILIYLAFVIQSTGYSLGNEEHFINNLFGYQVGDYTLVNGNDQSVHEVIKSLDSMQSISQAVYVENIIGDSTMGLENSEKLSIGAVHFYGKYPEEGLNLAKGRVPVNNKEVVISSDLGKKTGKSVGDYILIKTSNLDVNYFVSGVINTVGNGGMMYLIFDEEVPEDLAQKNGSYWIYSSEEHVIIKEVEENLKMILGKEVSVSKYDANIKNVLSTLEMFPLVINSLLVIFLLVCGVIIFNFTMIDINQSTRVYGVMKTIGYSNSSITRILVIRTVLLTSIGVIIGFVLNILTSNLIMQGIFKITPFSSIEMPVLFDGKGSLLLILLFIIMAIVATLIPARRVNRISPKMLISE